MYVVPQTAALSTDTVIDGLEAARNVDIMTKKLVIKEEYGTKEKMESETFDRHRVVTLGSKADAQP